MVCIAPKNGLVRVRYAKCDDCYLIFSHVFDGVCVCEWRVAKSFIMLNQRQLLDLMNLMRNLLGSLSFSLLVFHFFLFFSQAICIFIKVQTIAKFSWGEHFLREQKKNLRSKRYRAKHTNGENEKREEMKERGKLCIVSDRPSFHICIHKHNTKNHRRRRRRQQQQQ